MENYIKNFFNILIHISKKHNIKKIYNEKNSINVYKYKEKNNSQNIKIISLNISFENKDYTNYQWFGKIKYKIIDNKTYDFSGFLTELNNLTIGISFEDILKLLIKDKIHFKVN